MYRILIKVYTFHYVQVGRIPTRIFEQEFSCPTTVLSRRAHNTSNNENVYTYNEIESSFSLSIRRRAVVNITPHRQESLSGFELKADKP